MIDADVALLAQIAQGDTSAIKQMVSNKLPRLLALATRMLGDRAEAEDVAQETFVKIWNQAPLWKPELAKFDTWMHRVALNLCYDRLRTKSDNHTQTLDDDADEPIDLSLKPDEKIIASQQKDQLGTALKALPNRQREALVLQYYQELSNTEAASVMNISVDALESLLSRARRNMRLLLSS